MRRWKVACFDLDGTLVRSASTGQHLAKRTGRADQMAVVEAQYKAGKVSNSDVAALDGKFYRGYSVSEVHRLLDDIPTVDHIDETVSYLTSIGVPSLVCTLAWKFVAEYFAKRYGFVDWSGPDLVVDSKGVFTGKVQSNFHETDKPLFVREFCRRNNASLSEVFHVGDSRSDVPLFETVGFSVAFNADETAKAAASVWMDSDHSWTYLLLYRELSHKKILRTDGLLRRPPQSPVSGI